MKTYSVLIFNSILTSNNTTHLALCLVGKNSAYNVTLKEFEFITLYDQQMVIIDSYFFLVIGQMGERVQGPPGAKWLPKSIDFTT